MDAGIIPPLIHLLATAEFDIKKEAAWAISNATSGGTAEQLKYLVSQGAIKPLCDLLSCSDARIVTVALEGLENILKVGGCAVAWVGHMASYVWLHARAGWLGGWRGWRTSSTQAAGWAAGWVGGAGGWGRVEMCCLGCSNPMA